MHTFKRSYVFVDFAKDIYFSVLFLKEAVPN